MRSRFSKKDQQLRKPETELQISGYGGLTYLSDQIVEYIPSVKTYVEPFAGLGRIAKKIKCDKMILNDKSDYAYEYLKKNFPNAITTNEDFIDCIKRWDSQDTLFFCDPPWRKNIYKNHKEPVFTFDNVKSYYIWLLYWLPKCMGKWIITSDRAEIETNKALSKSGFHNITLENNNTSKIFGRSPAVRLCSNFILCKTVEKEGSLK